jgi:Salmonella virulence plasmid 65kDa B protein
MKPMRHAHRWLSLLLIAYFAVGHVGTALPDQAEPESFTFSEQSAPTAAASGELSKSNNLGKRSAPVSSSGTFGHSLAIDVPPGRLGITPQLTLSYSSAAHREERELGAGWNLSTRAITRSTQNGFPPVVRSAHGVPVYDDDQTTFEDPDGPMVPVNDGPTGASGKMYAPKRERSSVRYEHVYAPPSGFLFLGEDRWIEHHPSGVKRYYGLPRS